MDKKRRFVFHVTVAAILTGAVPFMAEADQIFSVQTPSGSGTGTCFAPYPGCSLAGLLGTDTALNAGGRFTDFVEIGQTGPIPPGMNIIRAYPGRADCGDGYHGLFDRWPPRWSGLVATILNLPQPGRFRRPPNIPQPGSWRERHVTGDSASVIR
jgi:hypothetical protein